jgi:hypothetical protein
VLTNQPEIDLVDKGRLLQRVAAPFAAQMIPGQLAQIRVHQGNHRVARRRIPAFPLAREQSYRILLRLHLCEIIAEINLDAMADFGNVMRGIWCRPSIRMAASPQDRRS